MRFLKKSLDPIPKKPHNQYMDKVNKVKKVKRDANGLIAGSSVNYAFNDDGLIDWRKMIKTEYLVSNRDRTSETDVTKLKDNELIILLGGIKELAQIRGFTSVEYTVTTPSSDYVVATCRISWIPNYETENEPIVFSAIGDASFNNTKGFGKMFLAACAENRAFVRCVRNFLRINIVAQEELGNAKYIEEESSNNTDPHFLLERVMKEKGVSFERLQGKLLKEDYKNASSFSGVQDIPKNKVFELIERIKKVK
tara:strand:- start:147 stop:905 length:759 start_codon:yes stop_codon:yes gene_type:complete